MDFYIRFRGKITGPMHAVAIVEQVKAGKFGRLHEVSSDKIHWSTINDHPEIRPLIGKQSDRTKNVEDSAGDSFEITALEAAAKSEAGPVKKTALLDEARAQISSIKPANSKQTPDRPKKRGRWSAIIAVFVVVIAAGAGLTIFLSRPKPLTWEEQNKATILQLHEDLRPLLLKDDWLEIHDRFASIVKQATTQPIHDSQVIGALAELEPITSHAETELAKLGIPDFLQEEAVAKETANKGDNSLALAKYDALLARMAIVTQSPAFLNRIKVRVTQQRTDLQNTIARLDAEEKARKAEQERKEQAQREAEARRQAEEARIAAEKAQQQREAEQRAIAAANALAAARITSSREYAAWSREADTVMSRLRTDLIGENSAWRFMNARSKAGRDLLAIYVKIQGKKSGAKIDADVEKIIRECESDMIGEDSALRAIMRHDQASLDILGVWVGLLDDKQRGIKAEYDRVRSKIRLQMISEKSAYRAISAYTEGQMLTLKLICSQQGLKDEAAAIVTAVQRLNLPDDSVHRESMRNSEGIMQLLLISLDTKAPDSARLIKRVNESVTDSDDSAIRIHSNHRQAIAECLRALIRYP